MSFPFHLRLRLRSMVCSGVVVGSLMLLAPAVASAWPDVTIYLTNAPSYCVARAGGNNSSGATVYLNACSAGQNHWYEITATPNNFLQCASEQCITFHDYWNQNVCFGINNNNVGVDGSCNAEQQMWINSNSTELHNAFWGGMLVTGSDSSGSALHTSGQPIDWHQWSGW
jgi:hypothetical protein